MFSVKKIWDEAPHSGFPDLIYAKDRFYCTFREGTTHVPVTNTGEGDGALRVVASKDGEAWESAALFKKKGYDLREARISEMPDGRLMLIMGFSMYVDCDLVAMHPHVSFSDRAGEVFSDPEPAVLAPSIRSGGDWIWRVAWHKGIGYGVVYRCPLPARRSEYDPNKLSATATLVKTVDGVNYAPVRELEFPPEHAPTEATIRFDDRDAMYILLRRERGLSGVFGQSRPPYADWTWKETGKRLGGPNFIFLPDGKILIGSRHFHDRSLYRTASLYGLDEQGKMAEIVRLPSGGDTGYPGLAVRDDALWVAYYSGHEGKPSIYLAKFPLDEIEQCYAGSGWMLIR